MPLYRVIYENRNGTTFEADFEAPTELAAETAAAKVLTQHVRRCAGRVTDWHHALTTLSLTAAAGRRTPSAS